MWVAKKEILAHVLIILLFIPYLGESQMFKVHHYAWMKGVST